MSLTETLRRLEIDGFCVLEGIIPDNRIDAIRESVLAAQVASNERTEAEFAKTRARGHRIGVTGVGALRGVINETQTFAPYLADQRILEVVEAVFGAYARISCTDCVVNYPGNQRGYLHADWPYNQTNASHVQPPYPDAVMHLSTLWMLSPFSVDNGGTIVIPGSHRARNNPAAGFMTDIDRDSPYPTEIQVSGGAGSVLVCDSRLWHAVAPNRSDAPRVALLVRYAPWWLNLNPTMVGAPEHAMMVAETGGKNYEAPLLRREVYESLPDTVKPLYRHWVEQ